MTAVQKEDRRADEKIWDITKRLGSEAQKKEEKQWLYIYININININIYIYIPKSFTCTKMASLQYACFHAPSRIHGTY